jgi:hypothetical protein
LDNPSRSDEVSFGRNLTPCNSIYGMIRGRGMLMAMNNLLTIRTDNEFVQLMMQK